MNIHFLPDEKYPDLPPLGSRARTAVDELRCVADDAPSSLMISGHSFCVTESWRCATRVFLQHITEKPQFYPTQLDCLSSLKDCAGFVLQYIDEQKWRSITRSSNFRALIVLDRTKRGGWCATMLFDLPRASFRDWVYRALHQHACSIWTHLGVDACDGANESYQLLARTDRPC